ncbi:MAG: acylneuraminate cytidylyltransferase family protein [Bacteroidota bacterium]|nr:acylneuraminate cytidylyltransferase family protein [Bacteroidota bacterium]
MKITAVVFVKKESERVPGKNFRLFNGKPLFTVILQRLEKMDCIDSILVDSDSEEVLEYVSAHLKKGIPITRPDDLLGGLVSGNDLLQHDINFSDSEHFFLTHCTNPCLTEETMEKAIAEYFSVIPTFDSLFSVTRIQNRLYYSGGQPVNHAKGKTLRTQDLDPVYEENACFFIFSRTSFIYSGNDRIGSRPFLFEISTIEGVDIDYEEDFQLAELIEKNRDSFPQIFSKD